MPNDIPFEMWREFGLCRLPRRMTALMLPAPYFFQIHKDAHMADLSAFKINRVGPPPIPM